MPNPVIHVENLSKLYKIGERQNNVTLRDVIAGAVSAPARFFRARKPPSDNGDATHIWALKDVSFEIRQGEVVGIIGRNGAGKSTLLKILARVTKPTTGYADVQGRMGSLLEVGTGFHPELTGRENTYLNGAILGMSKKEVARKFDEIVAFAEIEKFIDTPVKHYSSGMYLRLAFSVAAHLDTEILIVDEVLAVGDAGFQRKCLARIESVARQGRTVIFVSHNSGAVQRLTERCLLLQGGQLVANGETAPTLAQYQEITMDRFTTTYDVTKTPRISPHLSRKVEFLTLEMENYPTRLVPPDADITLRITVQGNDCTESFFFGLTVFKIDGTPVGAAWGSPVLSIQKGAIAAFGLTLHEPHLAPGLYYLGLGITRFKDLASYEDLDVVLDLLHFEILPPPAQETARRRWNPSWGSVRFQELTASRLR